MKNKPGTTKIAPALATSWKASKNGLTWTFNLRRGREVHGRHGVQLRRRLRELQPLVHRPAELQGDDISYYWNTVFGGYAKPAQGGNGPDKALYRGCKTAGANTAQIIIKRPFLVVPRRARSRELRHCEPDRAREVQGGRGTRRR